MNRITEAIYENPMNLEENYNLDFISYDKNGNITKLQRHGLIAMEKKDNTIIKKYGSMDMPPAASRLSEKE